MNKNRKNWLHLDFKGALPSVDKFKEFFRFWKECGYNGVVLEYDDRIPWRCWPEVTNHRYNMVELEELHAELRRLQLEIVPLIQTHGHLEWLLKLPAYQHWRENGAGSEICPSNLEIRQKLKKWIDEVVQIHPDIRYLHLGGDETFYLGSCPKCNKIPKMELYLSHISELCDYVSRKGIKPLIWADMFISENRMELSAQLPEETILVDWNYHGSPPYDSTEKLLTGKHEVMGASGVMVSWWEQSYRLESNLQNRINNVSGWFRYGDRRQIGIIHTTWTRVASLWHIFGPWHGAIPAFIAGGNPEVWEKHPWSNFIKDLSPIMERDIPWELEKAAQEILLLPAANTMEAESLRWWNLALRYQMIQKQFLIDSSTRKCLDRAAEFLGRDEAMYYKNCIAPFDKLSETLQEWESEAHQFWQSNTLSNEKEFFATHSNILSDEIKTYRNKAQIL